MMKTSNNWLITFVMGILLLSAQTSWAGPFGLEMGMKLSELKDQGMEIDPFKYKITDVPKKHSAFSSYVLKFGPRTGLCYIKAVGKMIDTDDYGKELQVKFDDMAFKLQKIYGKYEKADELRQNSSDDDDDEWMESLISGDRILAAYWDAEKGSKMKGNLLSIILAAQAATEDDGYLVIDYKFSNYPLCESEISYSEDNVL